MARTKIIATLGPASSSRAMLKGMVQAGLDMVRLNFSHGTEADHQMRVNAARSFRNLKILQDLEGFRIRIGKLHKPLLLKKGAVFKFSALIYAARGREIPFDYAGDLRHIKKGQDIFIDDGNIALTVTRSFPHALEAQVVVPGLLKERKGVNMPDAKLTFSSLTEKDKGSLLFAVKNRVDYIAQSFVRDAADIEEVRGFIKRHRFNAPIIAKIENREGIQNLNRILKAADGIMVARGDMGVSLPIWEVPLLQKWIIQKCNRARKPVIVATQMLESMTENLRPTRAEVSDVANAILDGANCVMLSGETAIGKHPVATVRMMNSIAEHVEKRGVD